MMGRLKWAGRLIVLVAVLFVGVRINNERLHRARLEALLALPALRSYALIDSVSYVGPSSNGCTLFAGACFCTAEPPERVMASFSSSDQQAMPDGLTFVWAVGDSFVVQPLGMGKVVSPSPINISWMGADVNKGVQGLWASGTCALGRMLVFQAGSTRNWGDVRCF